MALTPKGLDANIKWYEEHIAKFVLNAVAIGSSAAETTALQGNITAARAAMVAQGEARPALPAVAA